MSLFIIWLSAMLPLVFSPGPANIVFAASGAKVGVKRSIPLIMGVDTVFIIKSLVVGYGLGEVVQAYPNVMNVVQIVGALYLTFLAYKFIRSSANKAQEPTPDLSFIDGLLIQVLNSKGWLMVFLMFTLFTEQAQLTFGEHGILVLVLWLAILNISVHFVWVKLGVLLASISSNETYEQALNIFYASCLLTVSGWLMIDNPLWASLL